MVSTPLKNISQISFIFPNFRGENNKYLSCHHLEKKSSLISWDFFLPRKIFESPPRFHPVQAPCIVRWWPPPLRPQNVPWRPGAKQLQPIKSSHVCRSSTPLVSTNIPSRGWIHIPPKGKFGKSSSTQNAILMGYVSSLEGSWLEWHAHVQFRTYIDSIRGHLFSSNRYVSSPECSTSNFDIGLGYYIHTLDIQAVIPPEVNGVFFWSIYLWLVQSYLSPQFRCEVWMSWRA